MKLYHERVVYKKYKRLKNHNLALGILWGNKLWSMNEYAVEISVSLISL